MDGLKVGNEALKKVNDMLNIEDVEKILDETREAVDKQKVSWKLSLVRRQAIVTARIRTVEYFTVSLRCI